MSSWSSIPIGDLLAFGLRNGLLPLAVWSVLFTVAAIVVGALAAWWSLRFIRASNAAGLECARGQLWCGLAIIVGGCFLIPLAISLFHAIPFAIQRGLASGIEQAMPGAVGWVVDLATSNTTTVLAVNDQDAAINLRALKQRVQEALQALPRESTGSNSTWEGLTTSASTGFLVAVQRALDSIDPATEVTTWRDVSTKARTLAIAEGKVLFSSWAWTLRATAFVHVYWAALLIFGCNLVSLFLFRLTVRPTFVQAAPTIDF